MSSTLRSRTPASASTKVVAREPSPAISEDRGVRSLLEARRIDADRELRLRAREVAPVGAPQDGRVAPDRQLGNDERELSRRAEPAERNELHGRPQRRRLEAPSALQRNEEHVNGDRMAIGEPDRDRVARPRRLRVEAEDEVRRRRPGQEERYEQRSHGDRRFHVRNQGSSEGRDRWKGESACIRPFATR